MVVKEAIVSAPRKYPAELRERAVRLVIEDGEHGAIARVADRLGINPVTLRNWVKAEQGRARRVDRATARVTSSCSPAVRQLRSGSPAATPDPEPRSNPNVPTLDTLNDARFAQFACIRSVAVETCDYGSEGRGFESLPARLTRTARYVPVAGRSRVFGRSTRTVIHRAA